MGLRLQASHQSVGDPFRAGLPVVHYRMTPMVRSSRRFTFLGMDNTTFESGATGNVPMMEEDRPLSHGTRSRPLLGLPIARLIPMDVHTIFDYAGGLGLAVVSYLAESNRARAAGTALGAATIAVSLITDYRISAVKLLPIEVHEMLDYFAGFATLAAPFVLGYRRRERLVSAVQIAGGIGEVLVAMFTDYRAYRGRHIGFRSRSAY
jgi:hypothetical protein